MIIFMQFTYIRTQYNVRSLLYVYSMEIMEYMISPLMYYFVLHVYRTGADLGLLERAKYVQLRISEEGIWGH